LRLRSYISGVGDVDLERREDFREREGQSDERGGQTHVE